VKDDEKLSILVVDDDADARFIIVNSLKDSRYFKFIVEADSNEKGLEKC
jgi:CheY-like chemotaxis protein